MGTAGASGVDWLRFTGSFLLVLLLLGGMLWMLRRMKAAQVRQHGPALLELRETLHVGPRQKIALLRVGDKHVLVGISGQQFTALGQWDALQSLNGESCET
jgi:flagellar biogenesis protein FliO